MNQHLAQPVVIYHEALLEHLLGNYLSNAPLPGPQQHLTPDLLHRLFQAILTEGYGSVRVTFQSTGQE